MTHGEEVARRRQAEIARAERDRLKMRITHVEDQLSAARRDLDDLLAKCRRQVAARRRAARVI